MESHVGENRTAVLLSHGTKARMRTLMHVGANGRDYTWSPLRVETRLSFAEEIEQSHWLSSKQLTKASQRMYMISEFGFK